MRCVFNASCSRATVLCVFTCCCASSNLVASRCSPFPCVCPPPCRLWSASCHPPTTCAQRSEWRCVLIGVTRTNMSCCPSSELSLAPNPTANTNASFFLCMGQAVDALPPRIRSPTTNGTITAAPGFHFVNPSGGQAQKDSVALAASPSVPCTDISSSTTAREGVSICPRQCNGNGNGWRGRDGRGFLACIEPGPVLARWLVAPRLATGRRG